MKFYIILTSILLTSSALQIYTIPEFGPVEQNNSESSALSHQNQDAKVVQIATEAQKFATQKTGLETHIIPTKYTKREDFQPSPEFIQSKSLAKINMETGTPTYFLTDRIPTYDMIAQIDTVFNKKIKPQDLAQLSDYINQAKKGNDPKFEKLSKELDRIKIKYPENNFNEDSFFQSLDKAQNTSSISSAFNWTKLQYFRAARALKPTENKYSQFNSVNLNSIFKPQNQPEPRSSEEKRAWDSNFEPSSSLPSQQSFLPKPQNRTLSATPSTPNPEFLQFDYPNQPEWT